MDRKLKFRFWNGESFKYREIAIEHGFYFSNEDIQDCWSDDEEEHTILAVDQFTGLTDKGGMEIYENDILDRKQSNSDHGLVHFHKHSFLLRIGEENNFAINKEDTILGDIHNHPNLIESNE